MLIAINHDLFSLGGCFVSEFRYKQWAFAQKVKAEFDQGGRGVLIFFLMPCMECRWRRQWQPTPVFLTGESQGRGSLVGCHLHGRTESDTTEAT